MIIFLRYLIVFLLLTALASPVESIPKPPNENEGVNIVLALDASGSMNQSRFDEKQSDKTKFELVQDVAKEFITNRGEDNVGVVLFGDFAFVSSPITYEKEIVKEFIDRYDVGVAGESTAIGEALYKSAQALNKTNSKSKVIILLTDGKHNSGKISPENAMIYINESNIKVYSISISKDGDSQFLTELSQRSGGKYFEVKNYEELQEVYAKIDSLERSYIASATYYVKEYYYYYPLIVAIVLMVILYLLLTQKSLKRERVLLATIVFATIALSKPTLSGNNTQSSVNINDIMIALDLSYSMSADDIAPSRFVFAKEKIRELVDTLQSRIALIGFTSNAVVLSPPTLDKMILKNSFDLVEFDNITSRSTELIEPIKLASQITKNSKYLILVTDGGEVENFDKEIQFAKEQGIKIFVYLVATKSGAILKEQGEVLYDNRGKIVVSRANLNLRDLAHQTGGKLFFHEESDNLIDTINDLNHEETIKIAMFEKRELFYLFILIAVLLFLEQFGSFNKKIVTFFALFGFSLSYATENSELLKYNEANFLYKKGEYTKALKVYSSVKSSDKVFKSYLFYNMGNSLAKQKKFSEAKMYYINSLILHEDNDAKYNLLLVSEQIEKDLKSQNNKKKRSDETKESGGGNAKFAEQTNSNDKHSLGFNFYSELNKRGKTDEKPW